MYCRTCGKEQDNNVGEYCPNCGTKLIQEPDIEPGDISLSEVKYAGFWKRLVAYIIDWLLLLIVNLLLGVIFGANYIGFFIEIIVAWLYFAIMESSSSQATLGKMAFDIIVTDNTGNRISFGRATGRHFAKYISGIILCIGFFMIGFTKKKQGLHDMIANTLVILKKQPT